MGKSYSLCLSLSSLSFPGLGVVCKSFRAPPVLHLSFFFPSLFLPPHYTFYSSSPHLSPPLIHPSSLQTLSLSLSHLCLLSCFHPSCSLAFPSSISYPPPFTLPFLTSHLSYQPPHPMHTHTIYCRLVRQTNRHNSPDKGIETLITSILHEELKILQKKDVPLPLWKTKQRHWWKRMPHRSFERQNKDDDIYFLWCTPGLCPWSYFLYLCIAIRLHRLLTMAQIPTVMQTHNYTFLQETVDNFSISDVSDNITQCVLQLRKEKLPKKKGNWTSQMCNI